MYHDANHFLEQGRAAVERGDSADARLWFDRALEIDGENVEAMLWLAGLSSDPLESMRYVEMALAIDPENPHALEALAWARSRVAEMPAEAELDPEPLPAAVLDEPDLTQAELAQAGVVQPIHVPDDESPAERAVFDLREVAVPRDQFGASPAPAGRRPMSFVSILIAFLVLLLLIGIIGVVYTIMR